MFSLCLLPPAHFGLIYDSKLAACVTASVNVCLPSADGQPVPGCTLHYTLGQVPALCNPELDKQKKIYGLESIVI